MHRSDGWGRNTRINPVYFHIGNWCIRRYYYLVIYKQEEPYEGRLSRTFPWEREGEIPLRDSITATTKNMQFLQMQYDHLTNISKEEIFKELLHRIKAQKADKKFFKWDLVNYQSFKIVGDRIEVERTPSILTPFTSIGTIYYDLISNDNETKIKCTIVPFNKYALILGSCIFSFFLLLFSAFILVSLWNEIFKAIIIVVIAWAAVVGTSYISLRFSRIGLEGYSRTILNDLRIKSSSM